MKLTIKIINANQGLVDGELKVLNKLYEELAIKHPNSFHIRMYSKTKWDGIVHYLSSTGKFRIGLLPMIYKMLTDWGHKVEVIDYREPIPVKPSVPNQIGELTPRDTQKAVIETIINHKVAGVPFYIGVQDLSVNFGKSLIMAGLFLAFKKKLKTLLLTNDSDWLEQSKGEFPKLLPDTKITYIRGGREINWSMFSIGMVQSIAKNLESYDWDLSKVDMVLIDECDLIDNKTYKSVIERLFNTRVRIGLSGTVYMSTLKKNIINNMNIRSFIGDVMSEVKIKDTIKSGDSTNVIVKIVPTNFNEGKVPLGKYPEEYEAVIIKNPKAYKASLQRALRNYNKGRFPMLVVTKYIEHCELLYKYYKDSLDGKITIAYVHSGVNTKVRNKTISDFREGKIDILISNSFISRGKNFPLLRYLQNTASVDSNEKTIQLLGRLVRTHESKKKTYLDDIAFNGKYLSRHSNHRKNYYLKQGLTVIKVSTKYPINLKSTK